VIVSTDGATAKVSWVAPVTSNGAPITGYRVQYRNNATSPWQSKQINAIANGAPATSTTITGLARPAVYQVIVIALTQFGSSEATASGYAITSLNKR
jgi:hypothetical protein